MLPTNKRVFSKAYEFTYMILKKYVIHDHVCSQLDALGGGGAPLLAAGIGVADVKRLWHKLNDRIFYDDILPPTGSQQISFARLLQLLADRRVKRITMLSDGKVAIVEVTCILEYLSLAVSLPMQRVLTGMWRGGRPWSV